MPSEQSHEGQSKISAFDNCKANSNGGVSVTVVPTKPTNTTNTTNIDYILPNNNVINNCNSDEKHIDKSTISDSIITIDSINRNDHDTNAQPEAVTSKIKETHKLLKESLKLRNNPKITPALSSDNTLNSTGKISSSPINISNWISFQNNITDVYHRKGRRLNGLQLPLHPLQVLGWLVLCVFCLATYSILIPSFNVELQGPLYGLVTSLYIIHIISHLAALLIDPADRELRRLHHNDRVVPEFDRSKHAHVIENGRCHLCNICTTSTSTKHCSVCNKCVGKFDHHCKWLNHCIGSRNYVAFLMCVVSAVCATLVILAAVLIQFALYFTKSEWLNLLYDYNTPTTTTTTTTATVASIIIERSFGNESTTDKNISKYFETITNEFDFNHEGTQLEILENEFLHLNSSGFFKSNTYPLKEMVNDIFKINNETNGDNITESTNLETITYVENMIVEDKRIQNNIPNVTVSGITVSHNIFLILIGCLGFLAAITAGLLLHLCFFHIYISFLGLTTYEYIRNHRQTDEMNKAKKQQQQQLQQQQQQKQQKQHTNHVQQNGNSSTAELFKNHHPSNKTNNSAEIYFCSNVHFNNNAIPLTINDNANDPEHSVKRTSKTQLNIHCCANSREYNHTAVKAYYMCSSMEETALKTKTILPKSYTSDDDNSTESTCNGTMPEEHSNEHIQTYHCCSSYISNRTQDRIDAVSSKANLSGRKLNRKLSSISRHHGETQRNYKTCITATSSQSSSVDNNQRCCMKSISKQQRWRRKWNCCTVVPDSPDIPNNIIASLKLKQQQELATKPTKATEIPVHFITTTSPNGEALGNSIQSNSPTFATNHVQIKQEPQLRQACNFPGARFRHFMRMLNPYRRPRCRLQNLTKFPLTDHLKQNQIRPCPKQLHVIHNGCQHHHLNVCSSTSYCDSSSSPQPPSSATTMSEPSTDSSNLTTPTSQACTAFKTSILPTSIIRGDTSVTYVPPVGVNLPPALPPPVRRKIPNPTDLDAFTETLDIALHPTNYNTLQSTQHFPVLNNLYKQQRRKLLRTRSPTLSPIHESGLSNPTSPQPCRHTSTVNSCTLTTCD